jgi:formyltetrahydrofolate deformylase
MKQYVLSVRCADGPGIVHAFSAALLDAQGNIIDNQQYGDPITSQFCMRTTFTSPIDDTEHIRRLMQPAADRFAADVRLRDERSHEHLLVMVSQYDHCLLDLLYRMHNGELAVEIPVVVSNHETCRSLCERYGVPFLHLPVTASSKEAQERRVLELVEEHHIDFIVLARYMQILSPAICAQMSGRIINIHHSFLPGFKGARPYQQAYERGVKMIGATAHYVTADLDEGPIIAQGVVPVDHSMDPQTLSVMGRDVERQVLARAVKLQAEDRLFLMGNRVVAFH